MTAVLDREPPRCDRCGAPIDLDGIVGRHGRYCSRRCAELSGEVFDRD